MKRVKIGIHGSVPISILQDSDITPTELKVYISLSSFQGTKGNCWPGREEIAKRSGLHISKITNATSELVKKGWITKVQRGLSSWWP